MQTGRKRPWGWLEKAMRLDLPGSAAYYSSKLGWSYRLLGRYEEAIAAQKRTLIRNPNIPVQSAHLELAVIYSELGRRKRLKLKRWKFSK